MKFSSKCLLILLFSPKLVFSQIERGSVGIVYFSDSKIAVAADSRGTWINKSRDDKQCKVTALGKRTVFIATGFSGYRNDGNLGDAVPTWSNESEAHRAYDRIKSRPQGADFVTVLANEWAKQVVKYVDLIYRAQPQNLLGSTENGLLTIALFGGVTNEGHLVMRQIRIEVNPSKSPFISFETNPQPPCHPVCILGKSAIALEILANETARARKENSRWVAELQKIPAADKIVSSNIRLVQLTEMYDGTSDVGGPIDALDLSPSDGVRWIQRKPNCPKQ